MNDRRFSSPFWGSIRKRAALLTSSLVAVVLAGFTWYVWREVESSLIRAGESRVETTATIIATQSASTTKQGLARFTELSLDPVITRYLSEPDATTASAVIDRVNRYIAREADERIEVWDANGATPLLTVTSPGSAGGFPESKRPFSMGASPMRERNGRMFTGYVADVTAHGQRAGYLIVSRFMKPQAATAVTGLVGSGATILVGNANGSAWTNL